MSKSADHQREILIRLPDIPVLVMIAPIPAPVRPVRAHAR